MNSPAPRHSVDVSCAAEFGPWQRLSTGGGAAGVLDFMVAGIHYLVYILPNTPTCGICLAETVTEISFLFKKIWPFPNIHTMKAR
jgi:hypothetical protein